MSDERRMLVDDCSEKRSFYGKYLRPALAEFVGVTLFVCIGCLSVQHSTPVFSGIGIAAAHGLTITLFVIAFGNVSGGHLNPVVTMGILLAGEIGPISAVFYMTAQMLGGLCGAALTRGILTSTVYTAIGGGAHTLGDGVSGGQGILCEIVLTCTLVLVVLMAAVDPQTKTALAPLAIGFTVMVDILAGVFVTGGSMNPARSFGPAVIISYHTSKYWDYHYVYWVGPILGSAIASIWYRFFLASSEKRFTFKEE